MWHTAFTPNPGMSTRLGSEAITSGATISSASTMIFSAAIEASWVMPTDPQIWELPNRSDRCTTRNATSGLSAGTSATGSGASEKGLSASMIRGLDLMMSEPRIDLTGT